ncbi:hypothetical protein [Halochromatium salexigens]|uniref:Uncharacterized protein n=1 Tax=Halochromatium salexigens TaxID=49447 RepID=A0AAJ0UE09_HALSE|nr:hypothetical protein [Halochromatium salexigens]MBK5929697.1 hypothetical protein [Halochromatium salexigens]
MDNHVFRETYSVINERYCPFEKSILTNQCACSRAERFCIAEREGVHCKADEAQARCVTLLDLLRAQARFALRTTDGRSALPHAKAMRVQVGGLRGLQALLHPEAEVPSTIDDIDAIVEAAIARFGRLEDVPFQRIVQQITAYRGRQRFRDRRR